MKRPPAEKKKTVKSKSSSSASKENDVYQYENDKIRNEKNRAGDVSDDSDGEFKGDDESIDDDGSEVGWDSDDEMAYGSLLSKKSSKSSNAIQSDDSDSDQEEPFEGEVLLSDLFSSKPKSAVSDSKKTSSSKTTSEDSDDYDYDNDDDENDGNDSEEEEGEEDEGDDDEDESADEEDEDESDDDNDAHNRLISAIDQFSKVAENQPEAKRKKISNQSAQESAFSSTADDGAVSMDALLGALGDSKGLSVVKKQLVDLEKGSVVPAYVEKVVAERIERTLAYEGTSLEMGKWQETVTSNRNIRTLDLAQDKRQLPNYKDLVKKFVPRTDMEREVQMILVQTGATDELAEKREEDELGSRNFSVEEMKERQAELAKVKALMFYEQMKRHRLNKIKSKAYRRIRKRQKGKLDAEQGDLADLDPELAREAEEKEALRQVKERMDMKHKNTGKWARMALQHGQHDESLRLVP
jgi:U3 small nucleolar RNA-associated protein 14